MNSETKNVIDVAINATHLALRAAASSLPRRKSARMTRRKQRNKGDNGKKVVHYRVPPVKAIHSDEDDDPENHGECIGEHITRLGAPCEAGEERDNSHSDAIDRSVNHASIALLPQESAQRFGGIHERGSR